MLFSVTNQFWSHWLWVWMQGLNHFTWRMVIWDGLFHLWSNSSPLQSPTRRSSRKGSFLLGRVTRITMWVLPFMYIWNCMTDCHCIYATYRIVCGFITGCCFNLSFQIWQLSQPMTWKTLILMGVLFSHSSMEIGKNSFVTWMRVCDATTTSVMKNCQSSDWFGWVNVLSPTFRIICYILECVVFRGVSS